MAAEAGPKDVDISYRLADYDYDLPEDLVAQQPASRREASRLLVLDRAAGSREHRRFDDLPHFLDPGDVLVVNDTRVVPARLRGFKETGGRVEVMVLDPYKEPERGASDGYECLIRASKRPRAGSLIRLDGDGGIAAEVSALLDGGKARVRFLSPEPLLSLLDRWGEVPLPHYILREDGERRDEDATSYQTVYARHPGAVAAPTAGLHFSKALIEALRQRSIDMVAVTLHVGDGTFSPVRVRDIRDHVMHAEYAGLSEEAAGRLAQARREGRRIVAVGTTVVRTLEWAAAQCGEIAPYEGLCRHYITPGYRFRVVDRLITNFHLPQSTLLLLVSAFAGRKLVLETYREAVARCYRFFSYGDAMLIL